MVDHAVSTSTTTPRASNPAGNNSEDCLPRRSDRTLRAGLSGRVAAALGWSRVDEEQTEHRVELILLVHVRCSLGPDGLP